jgi:hypothetical protein
VLGGACGVASFTLEINTAPLSSEDSPPYPFIRRPSGSVAHSDGFGGTLSLVGRQSGRSVRIFPEPFSVRTRIQFDSADVMIGRYAEDRRQYLTVRR